MAHAAAAILNLARILDTLAGTRTTTSRSASMLVTPVETRPTDLTLSTETKPITSRGSKKLLLVRRNVKEVQLLRKTRIKESTEGKFEVDSDSSDDSTVEQAGIPAEKNEKNFIISLIHTLHTNIINKWCSLQY